MGDAIAHAVLPGIVLAYVTQVPLIVGAFGAGLMCSGLIGFIADHCRLKYDTVMGVVFSSMFALGMVLYAHLGSDVHLDHILFGDIMGLSHHDLWQSSAIAFFVTGFLILKWRDLLLLSFDPSQAKASGLATRTLHYTLLIMLSISIVATLKAAGIIMAIALLIAPGAIAFLCTKRFVPMMGIAILVSVLCGFAGVYLSYFLDSAPAPTIIVLLSLIFKVAFWWRVLYSRRQGHARAQVIS